MATVTAGKIPSQPRALPRWLCFVWHDRARSIAAAAGLAALTGLVVARSMPRGPATAVQALTVMIVGLTIGLIAGLALRSRWAMLLTPVAHVAVFDLGRWGTAGQRWRPFTSTR